MKEIVTVALGAGLLCWGAPASAIDVNLAGLVVNSCIVTATPGTLGAEPGGTALSTSGTGGLPASVQVTAAGNVPSLSFSAPTLSTPVGFTGTATTSISYSANGALLQAETTGASAHALLQLLSTVSVSGRIVSAGGFATGLYNVRTVVTCQQ